MVTKNISLKEEAYHVLKSLQLQNESFSDTVLRLAKQFSNLTGSIGKGTLSEQEYEEEMKEIEKSREKMFEGR
ncbi:MAG: antitoxin VapB family protein [Candidatus Kariarchaeaceae archaeon]